MNISRRNVLIGSGAAVALGACGGPQSLECLKPPDSSINRTYSGGGDDEGDEPCHTAYTVPGQGKHGPLINFSTNKICLVYMEIIAKPFVLDVARIHFDNDTIADEWAGIERKVVEWIDRLNSAPFPSPPVPPVPYPWHLFDNSPPNRYWTGFKDFAFKQQHHVIFYVKNQGTSFDPLYPLWFGEKLQGSVLGYGGEEGQASKNFSFYGGGRKDITLPTQPSEWSDKAVYVRNHYQKLDRANARYEPISNPANDRRVYALNINAIARSKDGALEIPMIIDPDTGNMGEGQP